MIFRPSPIRDRLHQADARLLRMRTMLAGATLIPTSTSATHPNASVIGTPYAVNGPVSAALRLLCRHAWANGTKICVKTFGNGEGVEWKGELGIWRGVQLLPQPVIREG